MQAQRNFLEEQLQPGLLLNETLGRPLPTPHPTPCTQRVALPLLPEAIGDRDFDWVAWPWPWLGARETLDQQSHGLTGMCRIWHLPLMVSPQPARSAPWLNVGAPRFKKSAFFFT